MRILFIGFFVGLLAACSDNAPAKKEIVNVDALYKKYPDSVPFIIAHGNKMVDKYNFNAALKDGAKSIPHATKQFRCTLFVRNGAE